MLDIKISTQNTFTFYTDFFSFVDVVFCFDY